MPLPMTSRLLYNFGQPWKIFWLDTCSTNFIKAVLICAKIRYLTFSNPHLSFLSAIYSHMKPSYWVGLTFWSGISDGRILVDGRSEFENNHFFWDDSITEAAGPGELCIYIFFQLGRRRLGLLASEMAGW